MAATETIRIPLGFKAPDFTLLDTISDKYLSLQELKGEKATLVMFICNHCPYVKHVNKQLVSLANDYSSKGIAFIAISSNDIVNYPQDGPELMKENARDEQYPFPYLYDETQEVAKAIMLPAHRILVSLIKTCCVCIAVSWITPDQKTIVLPMEKIFVPLWITF